MTTGANFKVTNGIVQWWDDLIYGDDLIRQDHEARISARQGTYLPYPEYGNPYIDTLSEEISETERNLRCVSETKECALQDARIIDCVVDPDSIQDVEGTQTFSYYLVRADGGELEFEYSST